MKNTTRWGLLLAIVSLIALPGLSLPSHADDDDDADDGAATVLSPDLQWGLADSAWNRREYDDAVSLDKTFQERNPDHAQALEALWRNYYAFKYLRPNEDKRKETFDKLVAESSRLEKKYKDTDKGQAVRAAVYREQVNEHELGRPAAMLVWKNIAKNYPGTPQEQTAYWTLAEWSREANQYQDAIDYYQMYRKVIGVQEYGATAALREGWMWEALKNNAKAAEAYRVIYEGPYNWTWGQVGWSSVDAAERLKTMGEEKAAREMAIRIIDKTPIDNGGWGQIHNRAKAVLGEKVLAAKSITIYPHTLFSYTTDKVNIEPNAKLLMDKDTHVLVRLNGVTKETPFKATLSLTPKFDVEKDADGMQKNDVGGKPTYTADIAAPDAKGAITTDWTYRFLEAAKPVDAPDDLVISRKWEKAGPGWGNAIIRIQSRARWDIRISLPNNKTNVNNISGSLAGGAAIQPNEVNDGGLTFRWYGWYPLEQGLLLKIPVEVGGDINEYYPKIFLYHDSNRYANTSATGKTAGYDTKEFGVKLTADADFPFDFVFPANDSVTLPEITK